MIRYRLNEDMVGGDGLNLEYAVVGEDSSGRIVSRTTFGADMAAAEAFLRRLKATPDGDYRRAMDLGFEMLLSAQGYASHEYERSRVLIDIAHAYAHLASVGAKAYQS